MCEGVSWSNSYPWADQIFDQNYMTVMGEEHRDWDSLNCAEEYVRTGRFSSKPSTARSTLHSRVFKSATAFYPSRTIAVQNFLPKADEHVRSFVAMFGVVEICEIIRDDTPSCLAVVQYRSKTSSADALLAMPYWQVRGSNLAVRLLWNGPYENIDAITYSVKHTFKECVEKRVVCFRHLPRNISAEAIFTKCERYGIVESVNVHPQDQGYFAYVVFRSALSAAVATYMFRISSTSNATLMLGYSENGSAVLLRPLRLKLLDQYPVPLSAFDVRCIFTRFLNHSRLKDLLLNLQRELPVHHIFRPGDPDYCVRIPTALVKGVSLFIEVLLFDGNFLKNEDITDIVYQLCNHKYLFRVSIDFGLHKPIITNDDRIARLNPHLLRWNSFFILELQICWPWGQKELTLLPRIQGMNHIYSDFDDTVSDDDSIIPTWFGGALRHTSYLLSATTTSSDYVLHRNKISFLLAKKLPFVRLAGSYEDLNTFQLPVHVYSESQPMLNMYHNCFS